jgi:hypothetical protein
MARKVGRLERCQRPNPTQKFIYNAFQIVLYRDLSIFTGEVVGHTAGSTRHALDPLARCSPLAQRIQAATRFTSVLVLCSERVRMPTPKPTPRHTPNPRPIPTRMPALNQVNCPSSSSPSPPAMKTTQDSQLAELYFISEHRDIHRVDALGPDNMQ